MFEKIKMLARFAPSAATVGSEETGACACAPETKRHRLADALSRFVDTGVSETLAVTVPEAGGVRLRLICTNRLGRWCE